MVTNSPKSQGLPRKPCFLLTLPLQCGSTRAVRSMSCPQGPRAGSPTCASVRTPGEVVNHRISVAWKRCPSRATLVSSSGSRSRLASGRCALRPRAAERAGILANSTDDRQSQVHGVPGNRQVYGGERGALGGGTPAPPGSRAGWWVCKRTEPPRAALEEHFPPSRSSLTSAPVFCGHLGL